MRCILSLVERLTPMIAMPGDYVIREGKGRALYFINRGRVVVLKDRDSRASATLRGEPQALPHRTSITAFDVMQAAPALPQPHHLSISHPSTTAFDVVQKQKSRLSRMSAAASSGNRRRSQEIEIEQWQKHVPGVARGERFLRGAGAADFAPDERVGADYDLLRADGVDFWSTSTK